MFPCDDCRRVCGPSCACQFAMVWLLAWANDKPLPVCRQYEERRYHGLEGVKG
jgi:hypothetical protein